METVLATTKNPFPFGFELRNGATVIDSHRLATREYVVLARWPKQWVTWHADEEGCTFWGHYFDSLVEAAAYFEALTKGE
jgi:hypothetical protein